MCKNLMLIGIKKTERLHEFLKVASKYMSKTDDHGFGYHAITSEGKTFTERWFDPKGAFDGDPYTAGDKIVFEKMKGSTFVPSAKVYGVTGDVDFSKVTTIMCHARFATTEKTFQNVHPFIIDNTALIHNGVIQNAKQLTMKISTCDSEAILNEYLTHNVRDDINNIQKVANVLNGWYACGVMSKKGDLNYIDIFKDVSTPLWATYIDELGCIAICTKHEILYSTLSELHMNEDNHSFALVGTKLTRFNSITGEQVESTSFKIEEKKPVYSQGNYGRYAVCDYKTKPEYMTLAELDDFSDDLSDTEQAELYDLDPSQRYTYIRAKYRAVYESKKVA